MIVRALAILPGRRWLAASWLVVAVAVGAACTGDDAPEAEPTRDAASVDADGALARSDYPEALAVLGHSQAAGEGTGGAADPGAGSWASGTDPRVRSVYQRLLERNPVIEGSVANYAQPGATVAQIDTQARLASQQWPRPELILVQAIDNDIVCPADEADYRAFGHALDVLLETIAREIPDAPVFLTSQYGSPRTYLRSLTPRQRYLLGQATSRPGQPPGPCDLVDTDGRTLPREVRRLERIIAAYEARQAEVCDRHDHCHHDGGAFSRVVERRGDFGEDLDHLSAQGHRRAAAVAWRALQREGLLPRG